MKKGTLVGIVALVAFLAAIVGALVVLKKRGILFSDCCEFCCDDDCDCDDEDCDCAEDEAPLKKVSRKAREVVEEVAEAVVE